MADPETLKLLLAGTLTGAGQRIGHTLIDGLLQTWRGLSDGDTPTTTSTTDVASTLPDDEVSLGAHAARGGAALGADSAATTSTATATAEKRLPVTPNEPPPDKLARMQQQVLDGALARSASLDRLAELTTRALEQAGVTPPELQRWQRIADCLAREPEWDEPTTTAPVSAAVAQGARPQTWFAWTRDELDRRLTTYLRRSIQRCGQACDQALRSLSDMAALRDLRSWKQELDLLDQLATSLPPLSTNVRALRPLAGRGKEATRALDEAALVAERMTTAATTLFQQDPSTPDWTESLTTCRRTTSQLNQHLRERRELR